MSIRAARWNLVDGHPVPPIHAVDPNGRAACDPRLEPEGKPADGDVVWQGTEVGACARCKSALGVANPRRVQL